MRLTANKETAQIPETYFWSELKSELIKYQIENGQNFELPKNDLTCEQNWPVMGAPTKNILNNVAWDFQNNGNYHQYLKSYLSTVLSQPDTRFLLVNNHPFIRVGKIFKEVRNLYVADYSLTQTELRYNEKQVSFPALPGLPYFKDGKTEIVIEKPYQFSFRGSYTHKVRKNLLKLNSPSTPIDVRGVFALPARRLHMEDYVTLIKRSHFSLVPRGHAIFSHRLLEVMKYGSIPIIIADDWVLPFSRVIDWERISIRCPEANVLEIPKLVDRINLKARYEIQLELIETYQKHFSSFEKIANSLFRELSLISGITQTDKGAFVTLNFDLENEILKNSKISEGVNKPLMFRIYEKYLKG